MDAVYVVIYSYLPYKWEECTFAKYCMYVIYTRLLCWVFAYIQWFFVVILCPSMSCGNIQWI